MLRPEAATHKQAFDARHDGLEERFDLTLTWWRQRLGHEPFGRLDEDSVHHERVKMHVEVQRAAKALDDGDRAAPPIEASALRAATVEGEHGPHHDAQHREREVVVGGEQEPEADEPVREDAAAQVVPKLTFDECGNGALRGSPWSTAPRTSRGSRRRGT